MIANKRGWKAGKRGALPTKTHGSTGSSNSSSLQYDWRSQVVHRKLEGRADLWRHKQVRVQSLMQCALVQPSLSCSYSGLFQTDFASCLKHCLCLFTSATCARDTDRQASADRASTICSHVTVNQTQSDQPSCHFKRSQCLRQRF